MREGKLIIISGLNREITAVTIVIVMYAITDKDLKINIELIAAQRTEKSTKKLKEGDVATGSTNDVRRNRSFKIKVVTLFCKTHLNIFIILLNFLMPCT